MKKVYGVGINDSDSAVSTVVNGKQVFCKIYTKWKNMLSRCYDTNRTRKNLSYDGCYVAASWLKFSNFKKWVLENDAIDKHLDKDLLVIGNKEYSPEKCLALTSEVNMFLSGNPIGKAGLPEGVSLGYGGKYKAYSSVGMGMKNRFIGTFSTPEEASLAYRCAKNKRAIEFAEKESDERVANALRLRYAPF